MNVKFTANKEHFAVWCLSVVFLFFVAVSTAKAADHGAKIAWVSAPDPVEFLGGNDVFEKIMENGLCGCEQAEAQKYFKNNADEYVEFQWQVSEAISEVVQKMVDSGQIPKNAAWDITYNTKVGCGL